VNLKLLNESPIHLIDLLRSRVEAGKFTNSTPTLMAVLTIFINKLETYQQAAVQEISKEKPKVTLKRCFTVSRSANNPVIKKLIASIKDAEKVRIVNDLNRLERKLLAIYDDNDIEVHNDR
jgi:exonuclease VII large subunit